MKRRLIIFLAATTALAADHCAKHAPAAYVRKAPVTAARLDPLAWTRVENIVGYLTTATALPAGEFCEYHRAYDKWVAWRRANPQAHSRWHPESDGRGIAVRIDTTMDMGEPGDYSAFGGCGCPLDQALGANGCGWVHSQIWY